MSETLPRAFSRHTLFVFYYYFFFLCWRGFKNINQSYSERRHYARVFIYRYVSWYRRRVLLNGVRYGVRFGRVKEKKKPNSIRQMETPRPSFVAVSNANPLTTATRLRPSLRPQEDRCSDSGDPSRLIDVSADYDAYRVIRDALYNIAIMIILLLLLLLSR